jgi:hypothetical protein
VNKARERLANLERGLRTAMGGLELNPIQRLGVTSLVGTFVALVAELIEEVERLKNSTPRS